MADHFVAPAYAAILTYGDWDKKKGIIAKIAGETGIGALLKKVEAAYKAVTWKDINLFQAVPQGNAKTKAAVEDAFKRVTLACAKPLRELELALAAANKKALETEAAWKKNKLIPSDSAKHVAALAKAADDLRNGSSMGTVNEFLKGQLKVALADVEKMNALWAKGLETLKTYVAKFLVDAKKITAADNYNALWTESIRGVGTQLAPLAKSNPVFQPEFDIWKKYSNKEGKPASDAEMKKWVEEMTKVIGTLKPKLDKLA